MGSEILNVAGMAPVSLQDFRHAYSLVASRAFKVDAYHVIAMVPVADACVATVCSDDGAYRPLHL